MTKIGNTSWADLKKHAMGGNKLEKSYLATLTTEEKDLVNALISA